MYIFFCAIKLFLKIWSRYAPEYYIIRRFANGLVSSAQLFSPSTKMIVLTTACAVGTRGHSRRGRDRNNEAMTGWRTRSRSCELTASRSIFYTIQNENKIAPITYTLICCVFDIIFIVSRRRTYAKIRSGVYTWWIRNVSISIIIIMIMIIIITIVTRRPQRWLWLVH